MIPAVGWVTGVEGTVTPQERRIRLKVVINPTDSGLRIRILRRAQFLSQFICLIHQLGLALRVAHI